MGRKEQVPVVRAKSSAKFFKIRLVLPPQEPLKTRRGPSVSKPQAVRSSATPRHARPHVVELEPVDRAGAGDVRARAERGDIVAGRTDAVVGVGDIQREARCWSRCRRLRSRGCTSCPSAAARAVVAAAGEAWAARAAVVAAAEGWTVGQTDGRTDGRSDGRTVGRSTGLADGDGEADGGGGTGLARADRARATRRARAAPSRPHSGHRIALAPAADRPRAPPGFVRQ